MLTGKKLRRVLPIAFLLCTASGCSRPKTVPATVQSEADVVKSFKEYVSNLMVRYKADKHERTEFEPAYCGTTERPGYVRTSYEPSTAYKLDVRKTDSLISPYFGTLLIEWNQHYSDCKETREKAQAQLSLGHFGSGPTYRYTYAFQDGKWVPTDREVWSTSTWESCVEERSHLAGSGYELDFGCSVPY